jgi:hypothetical protein
MSDSPVNQSNPGDVSTAVRNLLLSTKELQKILTEWSVGRVSETQVSDVYVQIGTDFNTAIQAFAYHRIEMRCACDPSPSSCDELRANDPQRDPLCAHRAAHRAGAVPRGRSVAPGARHVHA